MDPEGRLAHNQAAGNEKSDPIIISSSSDSENDLIKGAEATSELEEDDDDRDCIDDNEQSCVDKLNSDAVSDMLKLLDTSTVNHKNGGGSSVGRLRCQMKEDSQYKRWHQWWRKKTETKVPQWRRIKNLESESEESEDGDDDKEIGHRHPTPHVAMVENDFGLVKELTGHSQCKRRHQWRKKKTEEKDSQWQRIKNLESENEDSKDGDEDSEVGHRHPPLHVAMVENDFGLVKELKGHSQYKRQHQWQRKKTEKKDFQWQRIKNMESESEDSEDGDEESEMGHRHPPLHVAIIENDFRTVKERIKEDSDCIHELGYRKRTALHLAALEGRVDLVKLLLNHGADHTALDCYHLPAIAYAADGHPDCLRLLLDHANIKRICKKMRHNPQGMNLLHFAIGENREVSKCDNRAKCLELLFSQDKAACYKLLEESDARGFSPLVAAIYAGQHKVCE